MDEKTEVTLISPTKLGDRILKVGLASVTTAELLALIDAGAIEVSVDGQGTSLQPPRMVFPNSEINFDEGAFEAAVAAEASKRAQQAFDGALGKLEEEVKELASVAEKEKADLLARLDVVAQELTAERQKSADLAEKLTAADAEIATLKAGEAPAAQDTTPSEKIAKTAPKKAAATVTKG